MVDNLLNFEDLRRKRIVANRETLRQWIAKRGFPAGTLIGPNTRRWTETEIADWLEAQRAKQPQRVAAPAAAA